MPSRIQVIQGVEDNVEALKPVDVELRILDVCMVCHELDVGVELSGGLSRNLGTIDQQWATSTDNWAITKALGFLICS